MNIDNLATMILGAGGLGTAAFGVVEGLKWTDLGLAGFREMQTMLGPEIDKTLRQAYGNQSEELLEAQYRQGRARGEIGRTLRQGIRIGLPGANITVLAAELPGVEATALKGAAKAVARGTKPTDAQRRALARFELAVDARIDAALAVADSRYVGMTRCAAAGIAVVLALIVAVVSHVDVFRALLIGIAAVPLAPIAKDVVKGLRSTEKAFKAGR